MKRSKSDEGKGPVYLAIEYTEVTVHLPAPDPKSGSKGSASHSAYLATDPAFAAGHEAIFGKHSRFITEAEAGLN